MPQDPGGSASFTRNSIRLVFSGHFERPSTTACRAHERFARIGTMI
jgi:hypothetical protein